MDQTDVNHEDPPDFRKIDEEIPELVRCRRGGALADENVFLEAGIGEGGDEIRHLSGRDTFSGGFSGNRRHLEAVGPPPHVQVVSLQFVDGSDDGAEVGRHVADPGPLAEHPDLAKEGEQLNGMRRRLLHEIEGGPHAV